LTENAQTHGHIPEGEAPNAIHQNARLVAAARAATEKLALEARAARRKKGGVAVVRTVASSKKVAVALEARAGTGIGPRVAATNDVKLRVKALPGGEAPQTAIALKNEL